MIEVSLAKHLLSKRDVRNVTGAYIYPAFLPQKTKPITAVILQRITTRRWTDLGGEDCLAAATLQIDVYSRGTGAYKRVHDAYHEIRKCINGLAVETIGETPNTTYVHGVMMQNPQVFAEEARPGTDDWTDRLTVDCEIVYRQTQPTFV